MIEVNYNDYKRILEENMRLIPENHKLKEEVERLNNIINELEEYICAIEYDERHYNETWQIAVRIHNKLKELKGSNNNE